MSQFTAAKFATRQLWNGNPKAWRFLLRKWWRGLTTRSCVQCGCEKGRTLSPHCSGCQWKNIKKALLEVEEGEV
jgi:hypothetical protein